MSVTISNLSENPSSIILRTANASEELVGKSVNAGLFNDAITLEAAVTYEDGVAEFELGYSHASVTITEIDVQ